jgi:Spy/CpxP family protein refolding chaperone
MSDNRARIWFALFVLAVFCFGGATGFMVGRHMPPPRFAGGPGLFGRGPGRGGPAAFARGGPPPIPIDVVGRMVDDMDLDAPQRAQVKKILDEHRGHLEEVHQQAREQFDKEQKELHSAIRAVLRPDQQQKFDRFLERRP